MARIRFVLLFALVSSCVSMPDSQRADAIGHVSVSAPLFTPLDQPANGDKRLAFGDLRKEAALAAAIQAPSMGIDAIRFEALKAALAVHLAGTRETLDETRTTSIASDKEETEFQKEQKRTFQSPDVPTAPVPSAIPDAVRAQTTKLLERSGDEFKLPPDVVATLVAAYKTYMVNLEDYYNVDGYGYDDGLTSEFIPYRVHFTVSAEPGWYTRYHMYDAVVELTFGEAKDYRLVAVSPLETAQTIDQFNAELTSLQLAFAAQANLTKVAASGSVEKLHELAKRLEGLRANRTLVVGFPSSNSVRIRFRPVAVPTAEEQDLNPTARVMTALILVRNAKGKEVLAVPSMRDQVDSATVRAAERATDIATAAASVARDDAVKRLQESLEKSDIKNLEIKTPDPSNVRAFQAARSLKTLRDRVAQRHAKEDPDPETVQSLADTVDALSALGTTDWPATLESGVQETIREYAAATSTRIAAQEQEAALAGRLAGRDCPTNISAYFAAGVRDASGDWSAPRNWLLVRSAPYERYESTPQPVAGPAHVPPWYGPLRKPLRVENAFGYYWTDFSAFNNAAARLAEVERRLAEAEKELKDREDAVVGAKASFDRKVEEKRVADDTLASARKALDDLEASSSPDAGKLAAARKAVKEAEAAGASVAEAFTKAREAHETANGKKELAKSIVETLKSEAATARQACETTRVAAVAGGRASIGVRATAPSVYLVRTSTNPYARTASLWVRVAGVPGAQGAAQQSDWHAMGVGDQDTTLDIAGLNVDMSHVPAKLSDGPYRFLDNIRVFVEVALVMGQVSKPTTLRDNVIASRILEVTLEPRGKVPPGAGVGASGATPKPADGQNVGGKPDDDSDIRVAVEGVKIMLDGKAQEVVTSPAKDPSKQGDQNPAPAEPKSGTGK